jgi:RNA polymerase sigma-70 factor (ECF subfamily)
MLGVVETDLELLEAWRRGDREAAGRLFDRHFECVYRFYASKVELADVDDLVQQTYVGLMEARDRFRGDASVRTYLLAIARNLLVGHIRTRGRNASFDPSISSLEDLGPSPPTVLAERHAHQLLSAALRAIPLDLQLAVELYYWEELSAPELAVVLEIPEGTVRSRLRRALDLLRSQHATLEPSPDREESQHGIDAWLRSLGADADR